jgi:hypothetical protein
MSAPILACGPYFDEAGITVSLILFVFVKPLAYYAFVQAFRFRVSRPIPMSFSQAAWIAGLRAALGLGFVAAGGMLIWLVAQNTSISRDVLAWPSWGLLFVERLVVWTWLGSMVGLRGRRLLGWTLSGTGLNAAFDVAIVAGAFAGIAWPLAIVAAIGLFIFALHVIGRRDALKRRFSSEPLCATCGYNLTGNLSGICPECGTAIFATAPAAG